MRLIIAGSRTIDISPLEIFKELGSRNIYPTYIDEVVSGGANGVDKSGEVFAQDYKIVVKRFKADWDTYGKKAGPIRNKEMAHYADRLLLIWDGKSRGSANMKERMRKLNKPIYEVIV